jgi:RNA polymerase sigma-70 factor (ECF subfamily)
LHFIEDAPLAQQSVARTGAGDNRAALMQLFETHYDRVARFIALRIGSVDEAEDLASDVFVRALQAVDSYRDTGAPMEAWLFKIARNRVVDHLRDRGRRPPPARLEAAFAVGTRESPMDNLERGEEIQQLAQAMQHLSEAQRQVIALRFGAEMTSEQVAAILGKKPGAVREMQSAAISKLRGILRNDP